MNINANTETYCIFGNPVRHSLSPDMHNAAFKELGISALYTAFEIDSIRDAVEAMRTLGIKGASVTLPFKVDVIESLDEIDAAAERIGSVNTLVNVQGRILGYNTDGEGAMRALESAGVATQGARVLLIGNGGSARAVAFSLLQGEADVIVCGRNPERIGRLVKDLEEVHSGIEGITLDRLDPEYMKEIDIIINATSVGMYPDIDSCPINTALITDAHTVFDVIYRPGMTRLINAAEDRGCRTVMGIAMLLHQGVRQFELWTGMDAPVNVMSGALDEALERAANDHV